MERGLDQGSKMSVLHRSRGRRWSVKGLVNLRQGLVSREVFVNDDVYRRELDRVFARAWLFIGHQSQITKPGDYFVSSMGDESVILSRDRQGQIHVFLNTCRHRGMKVCRYDEGNTPVFTCPYHGWSYGLNGSLVGVPRYKEAYKGELDKSKWGLIEVAQLFTYKGTIWATWDPSAPPFLDYLGSFRIFLDALLDGYGGEEGGTEAVPGVQKWLIPSNWKFVSENFAGDHYHSVSHISVEAVGIGPGRVGEYRHGEIRDFRANLTSFPDLGHCWRGSPPRRVDEEVYPFPKFDNPAAETFFQDAHERRKARGDHSMPLWVFGGGGNVFPNTSFHVAFPRTIVVANPRGPTLTEMWRWCLVDKAMPRAVTDLFRHYFLRYAGPGGMTEQDDMENWTYATSASRGTIARRYPYNYQQGLGHGQAYEGLRGAWVTDSAYSEANALTHYKRWAEFMEAESWDELAPSSTDAQVRA